MPRTESRGWSGNLGVRSGSKSPAPGEVVVGEAEQTKRELWGETDLTSEIE
jgi:hypothetical protein